MKSRTSVGSSDCGSLVIIEAQTTAFDRCCSQHPGCGPLSGGWLLRRIGGTPLKAHLRNGLLVSDDSIGRLGYPIPHCFDPNTSDLESRLFKRDGPNTDLPIKTQTAHSIRRHLLLWRKVSPIREPHFCSLVMLLSAAASHTNQTSSLKLTLTAHPGVAVRFDF